MTPYRVILITAGNEDEAARIARDLVESHLAACVNIVNPVRSIYRWEGKVCDEQEILLIAKTHVARLAPLLDRVSKLHSYEVPEVIAIPIESGNRAYLKWVESSCIGPDETKG
jgi:periplasmic divalent cation tolerance protein